MNAHENIYIDAGKVFSLSLFLSFSIRSLFLSYARLCPVFLSTLLLLLLLLRRSFPVSPLGFPLVPCCSSLFSSTNDGNHPQTHQLTLFQSYRTTSPPFHFPLPSARFSLSTSACCVSSFADTRRGIARRRRISRS